MPKKEKRNCFRILLRITIQALILPSKNKSLGINNGNK